MYYADKLQSLKDIFGTSQVRQEADRLIVNGRVYPIIDDVIILLDPFQYTDGLKKRIEGVNPEATKVSDFAKDIQFTFGEEWQKFPRILPEHKNEFALYFDLVDILRLKDSRVCDLGCGIGRWSYFLKDRCRELVLVDFSEAIFVARFNLRECNRALFFMGDLKRLPFKDNYADFLFCIGVLHHLPTNALEEVRKLKNYAPTLLIYLYYTLDNRPLIFRALLSFVTIIRKFLSKIRNQGLRIFFTELFAILLYYPLIGLGKIFNIFGLGRYVPLYEAYNGKTLKRIRQDVYDRFFTRIEQRFSRNEILALKDTFKNVTVSEALPFWHFLCKVNGE
jgi:SAM-dependent methyltransferase